MTDYFDKTVKPQFELSYEQNLEVEQQKAQVAAAEQAAKEAQVIAEREQQLSVKQKADAEQVAGKTDMNAGDVARTAAEAVAAPAMGMLDFGADALSLIPGLQDADNWWDEKTKFKDKNLQAIRDVASLIGPTILGGKFANGIKAATAGVKISNTTRVAGRVAAELGIDVGVTAISSQSAQDENLAQGLNEWLGLDIPWATRDEDSPDVRRARNIQEAAGLTTATSLLGLVLGRGGVIGKIAQKVIPRDEKAAQIVAEMGAIKQMDPVDAADAARETLVTDKAQREYLKDVNGDLGHNSWVNEPHEPQARGVVNVEANAVQAKIDTSRIARNIGTSNGRAAPVSTEYFQEQFMQAKDGTERATLLQELSDTLGPGVDAVIGKTKITAEMMDQDINNLTFKIFNSDPVEFAKDLESLRTTLYSGRKFLGEEGFVVAAESFKKAFDLYLDPAKLRASAMLVQQAAGNVADSSAAMNLLGDAVDTTRQQELVLENLRLVNQEVRANQYISGAMLEAKKIAKSKDPTSTVDFLRTAQENLENGISMSNKKAAEAVDMFLTINKENPEFVKPMLALYHTTNGDIDSIYKMNRWVENKLGVIKKAFVDGDPTVPSLIVEGMQAARYNSVLSGISALRAATGNATLMIAKPISILAGSALTGDTASLKRAFAVYGGLGENMTRAFQLMGQEWKKALANPNFASRADSSIYQRFEDDLGILDTMVDGWQKNGEIGKLAMYNLAKFFKGWNSNNFVRYGTNAMTAIDGFTQSVMASGVARAKAYDDMMRQTKGVFNDEAFQTTQQKLYSEMFDETGLMRDKAAQFASGEISLNLDNEIVNGLEQAMKRVPALKAIFMFPRTGLNALEVGWSFNPISALNLGIGRQRKVLGARTVDEMTEALAEHGMEFSQEAFDSLKAEYRGRQALGTGVVMAAGLFAVNGNLTGNGPQNAAELRRMQQIGWKPQSIRNPFTGDWISYKGLEPFDTLLGLVGDITYQASRLDEAVSEDFLRKVMYSISTNITNKTFLSGFQVVSDLLSQDEGAWNRFAAGQIDSLIPAAGVRSTLSRAIAPQLKDVENDLASYLKNRNRFLFTNDSELIDQQDIYTGEPINFTNPLIAAANALNPMFKVNGGTEVWRQWLINTGWDNLQSVRTNRVTGEQLRPNERQWVNNWIADNVGLKDQIISLMNDGISEKALKSYAKQRGLQNQKDFPIKEMYVHDQLDKMHDSAFKLAWAAYRAANVDAASKEVMMDARKRDLQRGAINSAADKNTQIQQLISIPK